MSAWRTQDRTDSTPYPSWFATRWTVPCSVLQLPRNWRTNRTAWAFSASVYRRVVGRPGDISSGMTPSSFPRSGASKQPRAIQYAVEDVVRIAVGHNLDAVVLDFFCWLGHHGACGDAPQSAGRRAPASQSSVTNNEVSAESRRSQLTDRWPSRW
jgi:hypothetical protein